MERVTEEFHACTIISSSARIGLSLSNNRRFEFNTWSEFEEFDRAQSEHTTSVSAEITLDVLRSAEGQPERYSVQVSVQNTPRRFGFMIGPIGISTIGPSETPPVPIFCRINYNNFILGKNIISTIEDWEKSVRKPENKTVNWMQKHSAEVAVFLQWLSVAACFWLCWGLRNYFSVSDTEGLSVWMLYSAAAISFGFGFGRIIGRSAEREIDRYSPLSNITLTSGDRQRNTKIQKKWTFSFKICGLFVTYRRSNSHRVLH